MLATLDKFGRIIIPKRIRKNLGINPESTLNISEDGKRIVIEPVRKKEPLIEKDGILVFTGQLKGKIQNVVEEERKLRMKKVLKNEG